MGASTNRAPCCSPLADRCLPPHPPRPATRRLQLLQQFLDKSDGRDKLLAAVQVRGRGWARDSATAGGCCPANLRCRARAPLSTHALPLPLPPPHSQYAAMFVAAGQPGNVKKVQASVATARKVFRIMRVGAARLLGGAACTLQARAVRLSPLARTLPHPSAPLRTPPRPSAPLRAPPAHHPVSPPPRPAAAGGAQPAAAVAGAGGRRAAAVGGGAGQAEAAANGAVLWGGPRGVGAAGGCCRPAVWVLVGMGGQRAAAAAAAAAALHGAALPARTLHPQAGLMDNKALTDRAQKASLYGWFGGSLSTILLELYELAGCVRGTGGAGRRLLGRRKKSRDERTAAGRGSPLVRPPATS